MVNATTVRLRTERNIWLATVRTDGRPHLIPIWFVWESGSVWICTAATSVKTRNLRVESRATFSLEDGDRPVVGEGNAVIHQRPFTSVLDPVFASFSAKYDWDAAGETSYDAVIQITPTRWVFPTWESTDEVPEP